MSGRIAARLAELGILLPQPAAPVAAYVPFTRAGNILYIAGQLPMLDGALRHAGKLGADVSLEDGYAAARLCALNLLAQARVACDGDLDRVMRCLKLCGYVNATADFSDHPKIVNGASELMVQVLGEAGKHARLAVGATGLPLNAAVEIDAIFEII